MVMRKGFAMGIVVLVVLTSFVGIISTVSAGINNGRNPDSVMDDEDVLHMVWQEPVGNGKGPTGIIYANNRWTEKGQGNMGIGNDKNPTRQILSNTPYTFSVNPSIEQTEEGWLHVRWTEKLTSGDEEVELWSADGGMNWLDSPPSEPWMRVGNYFEYETQGIELYNMTKNSFHINYLIIDIGKGYIQFNEKYIQTDVTIEYNTTYDTSNRKLLSVDGYDISDISNYRSWFWVSENDFVTGTANVATMQSSLTDPYVIGSPPTAEFSIYTAEVQSKVYYQLDGGVLYRTQDYWNVEGFLSKTWANLTDTSRIPLIELYPNPPLIASQTTQNSAFDRITSEPSLTSSVYYAYPGYYHSWDYTLESKGKSGAGTSLTSAYSSSNINHGTLYGYTDAYAHGNIGSAWGNARVYANMLGPGGRTFRWNYPSSFSQSRLRAHISGSANAYASLAGWWGASEAKIHIYLRGRIYCDATGYLVASPRRWTFIDRTALPHGIPSISANWNTWRNFDIYGTLYNNREYRFEYFLYARSYSTAIGVAAATSYAYMDVDISYFRAMGS